MTDAEIFYRNFSKFFRNLGLTHPLLREIDKIFPPSVTVEQLGKNGQPIKSDDVSECDANIYTDDIEIEVRSNDT